MFVLSLKIINFIGFYEVVWCGNEFLNSCINDVFSLKVNFSTKFSMYLACVTWVYWFKFFPIVWKLVTHWFFLVIINFIWYYWYPKTLIVWPQNTNKTRSLICSKILFVIFIMSAWTYDELPIIVSLLAKSLVVATVNLGLFWIWLPNCTIGIDWP